MALARASRIQEKLNSNELKSDVPIWKHSQAVLNCFKRALEIDCSNLSLWIEYGTMSYALHSFASRQLKQWRSELPPEVVVQVRCLAPSQGRSGVVLLSCLLSVLKPSSRLPSSTEAVLNTAVHVWDVSDGRKEGLHAGDGGAVFPGGLSL